MSIKQPLLIAELARNQTLSTLHCGSVSIDNHATAILGSLFLHVHYI